jgi:hypothetical protein
LSAGDECVEISHPGEVVELNDLVNQARLGWTTSGFRPDWVSIDVPGLQMKLLSECRPAKKDR